MPRAFISHRTTDRPFVEAELLPLLHHFDIETWYCKLDIAAGDVWEKEIYKGLLACDWFIVVLSPRATRSESPWVYREVCYAVDNFEGRIIPVLFEPVAAADVHLAIHTLQQVDFTAGDRITARLQLLGRFGVRATPESVQFLKTESAPIQFTPARHPSEVVVQPVRIPPLEIKARIVLPPQMEPPLSDEILKREGLLQGAADAIAEVERDTHPALQLGKDALAEAERQWQRLCDDLAAHPPRLAEHVRRQIDERLAANPDTSFDEVYDLLKFMSPAEQNSYFHRARNVARARSAWEKGRPRYESVRQDALTKLQAFVARTCLELTALQGRDRDELVKNMIAHCPGAEAFESQWQVLVAQLRERRYRCTLPDRESVRQRVFQALAEREWDRVRTMRTIEACEEYLRQSQTPRYAAEAEQMLASLQTNRRWEEAQRAGTRQALQNYLTENPNGPHSAEARVLLSRLDVEEVEAVWEHTLREDSTSAYALFISLFPNCQQAQTARRLLANLQQHDEDLARTRWADVKKADSEGAYEDFLEHFYHTKLASAARSGLAQLLRQHLLSAIPNPSDAERCRSVRRRYLEVRTKELEEQDRTSTSSTRLQRAMKSPHFEWLSTIIVVACLSPVIFAVIFPLPQTTQVLLGLSSLASIATLSVIVFRPDRKAEFRRCAWSALGPLPDSAFEGRRSLDLLRAKYLGEDLVPSSSSKTQMDHSSEPENPPLGEC